MHHSMKVAKWEIKRNLKNKSFLIGLFLTPLIFLGIAFLGSWLGGSTEDSSEEVTIYIHDELGLIHQLEEVVTASNFPWKIVETDVTKTEIANELRDSESTAYISLNEAALSDGVFPIYTTDDMDEHFTNQLGIFQGTILAYQMDEIGLSPEQAATLSRGIHFVAVDVEESPNGGSFTTSQGGDFLEKLVPAGFAAIIFMSIVFTGMAIFQSASQEKKDKIAEIILSSLTPGELMQGKIIGYFVLGLIQAVVLLAFLIPYILIRTDIPLMEYLFVPETALFVLLAVLNYLMFAAIFVGIGATMEDISTAGNFQGLVMMLPFLPFIFIGPVLGDPSGLMAQIGTYIPFTAPGVLLMRLAILDVWPWIEVLISLGIILISIVVFIKLAGKIFKVGILMYGKNATPGEIWKWIKAS